MWNIENSLWIKVILALFCHFKACLGLIIILRITNILKLPNVICIRTLTMREKKPILNKELSNVVTKIIKHYIYFIFIKHCLY